LKLNLQKHKFFLQSSATNNCMVHLYSICSLSIVDPSYNSLELTRGALQRNFRFVYSQKRNCAAQTQFPHSCVCSDLYVHTIGPSVHLFSCMQQKRQTDGGNIKIAHRNMNVGIGIVAAQFLFRIFGM
jgi:hypothetical protein